MTHHCQRCGEAIPAERVERAVFRSDPPTACSDKCGNALRQQRYRNRQRLSLTSGLPIDAIISAEGRDPQTGKQIIRELPENRDVRAIIREDSRSYREHGALRGRETALL